MSASVQTGRTIELHGGHALSMALWDKLGRVINDDAAQIKKCILDLREVRQVDSAGVASLCIQHDRMKKMGIQLVLKNCCKTLRSFFECVKEFDQVEIDGCSHRASCNHVDRECPFKQAAAATA